MAKSEIRSHLPGTFYRRPAPDRPPFKEPGDKVAKGDVIGLSVDHEDGSSTTMVELGEGHIVIDADQSLKGLPPVRLEVASPTQE